MTLPYASKTREDIRQMIGHNTGSIIVSAASTTGSTTTLADTYGLAKGGTQDYVGRQILILAATEAIAGKKSFVASFDNIAKIATFSPALTATTTILDTYEMWKDFTVEQVDDLINQAIVSASDDIFKDKVDATTVFKQANKYAYTIPTAFVALHTVEYEYSTKIDELLHACGVVWDELVDTEVTASLDTTLFDGNSVKLAVSAGCALNTILATDDITSADISDCDELVAEVYSSKALDAEDLQILLAPDAQCATPAESLNIPAVAANTKTPIAISLANPPSDTAIISVGVKMVVDKGAFNFWIRNIRAQNSQSRNYHKLSPLAWTVVQGTTPQLKLLDAGYSAIGNGRRLRLSGYQTPSELSDDTESADIDPDFIIAKVTGQLYAIKGDAESLRQATYWLTVAETRLRQGRTHCRDNTRWVGR